MNDVKEKDPLEIELDDNSEENVQDPIKIEIEDFKHYDVKIEIYESPTVDSKLSQSNQANLARRKSNQKTAKYFRNQIDKFNQCRFCEKTFDNSQKLNEHKKEHKSRV